MKKILAILLACSVALSTVACSGGSVATVDGKSISKSEFKKELKLNKWIYQMQYGDGIWKQMEMQDKNYKETIKKNVLESLIQKKLYLSHAEKNKIKPDEKMLKQYKEQNKKMLEDKNTKKSMDEAGVTEDMLDNYAKDAATLAAFYSDLEKKSAPNDKELKEYYDKNNKKIDASHILISTTAKDGKPVSEKEKAELKKKAEEIQKKAKDGEDFSKLAKENSQDPGSAAKGGELGEFGKGVMAPAFEKAAFNLKEGEVSDVVETQFGYHIIKLNKVVNIDFEKAKGELKTTLTQEKAQKTVSDIQSKAKIKKDEEALKKIDFGKIPEAKNTEKKDTNNKNSSTQSKKDEEKKK